MMYLGLAARSAALPAAAAMALIAATGCSPAPSEPDDGSSQPEHDLEYGIYRLDLATREVDLIYTSDESIHRIDLSADGSTLVFRQNMGLSDFVHSEICVVGTDGTGFEQLTGNNWLDAGPCWSPEGGSILFLSWPDYPGNTMDIYQLDPVTRETTLLYDSGFHDGDCDWQGERIVFTRESQIWIMDEDGGNPTQVTDYALAGVQGNADLPFGDYDPRIGPGGGPIVFERMLDDHYPSGNYDFFTITPQGTAENQITSTGYAQFIAEWSHAGDRLVFTVAAIDGMGVYDIYMMEPDGSGYENVTPDSWPDEFLCTHPIFSEDDSSVYFVGRWWE
ncbi:MAG: hypothetical protein GF400_09615 [Candidatus Eisenbacteria bacterium]|nr:hypothetical protein [Candidatus Eisenbacteria bacterium]